MLWNLLGVSAGGLSAGMLWGDESGSGTRCRLDRPHIILKEGKSGKRLWEMPRLRRIQDNMLSQAAKEEFPLNKTKRQQCPCHNHVYNHNGSMTIF